MAQQDPSSNELVAKLQELPAGVANGMILLQENAIVGRPWALLHQDIDGFLADSQATIGDGGVFSTFRVAEDCLLVEADMSKLLALYRGLDVENYFDETEVTEARAVNRISIEQTGMFFERCKEQNTSEVVVGLYNLNDSNTIMMNGTTYPSFPVTLEGANLAARWAGFGGIELLETDFRQVFELSGAGRAETFYVAPSGKALMVRLRLH